MHPQSSLWRLLTLGLTLKAPDSPEHGKTPHWCYQGKALGESQQASKAANDRDAKLMEQKNAEPVAKRTGVGVGTIWKPKGFKELWHFGEVC